MADAGADPVSTLHRVVPNTYRDSVALMAISAELCSREGVASASVVMATPANLANLAVAGLGLGLSECAGAKPSDILVAVSGTDEACAAAVEAAVELLTARTVVSGAHHEEPAASSLQMAVSQDPGLNLALVSVPGAFAAAEAEKALRLGMNVMVFSDNVPVEQEVAVKRLADKLGLMVMGPDCGTAIINGVPLGFANVVRRGPIGVVAASGTGLQEVTSRIHALGSGVSQALGTGGHDLGDAVGGISMLHGLTALERDPATQVIVLVSKPPSAVVAANVLARAQATGKPVVVAFLGADLASVTSPTLRVAATLAEAADIAVQLATPASGGQAAQVDNRPVAAVLDAAAAGLDERRRYVRGVFCGGTFCYETQLVLRDHGVTTWSNAPLRAEESLDNVDTSVAHTVVDMGADEFTQGRPHPMIDPTGRNDRVVREAVDPTTAVIIIDVVLGFGSAADPVSGLIDGLQRVGWSADRSAGWPTVLVSVCGTDDDPQCRSGIVDRLTSVGVLVAPSNAAAARWAAHIVGARGRAERP